MPVESPLVKVGITGGAGFIGGHVVDVLIARGHIPVIFDRRGRRHDLGDGTYLETFLGDVLDPVAMSELGKHVDGIIHLAACLGTQETIKNPIPAVQTNTIGGLNFLASCAENDIPGTYIGVGNFWMPNTYSISKTSVERYVEMFNRYNGTRVNVVRAVNAYGPRQSVAPPFGPAKVRKITPAFVCRALLGEQIEIYGDGTQISDMVYVKDVARALVSALESASEGAALFEPVGVGPYSKDSLTVNEVADIVRQTVGRFGGPAQPAVKHLPMRPGEIPGDRVSVDPDTLKLIGMDPTTLVDFEKGIGATIIWFRENWLRGYQATMAPVSVGS